MKRTGIEGQDRGAPKVGVKSLELGIEAGQHVVHYLPDLAPRMSRRDAHLQIGIAEKRSARLVRSAHHRFRQSPQSMRHVPQFQSRPD